MKYLHVVFVILVVNICSSQIEKSNDTIHVLFIGNSLTYYHDMPQMVQAMLYETDPNIKIDQSTFPGQSLYGHINSTITSRSENGISTRQKEEGEVTETELKIAERKWDVVILQSGTVRVLIPEARKYKMAYAISQIMEQVDNPECNFILFNTWPSKDDYPLNYCYPSRIIDKDIEKEMCCSPTVNNLEEHLKLINDSYQELAEEQKITKSDNGSKFYAVRTQHPDINLYDDTFHPSKYGSFLNACIFYQMLTGKKATKLKYIGEIEPGIAKILKNVAE